MLWYHGELQSMKWRPTDSGQRQDIDNVIRVGKQLEKDDTLIDQVESTWQWKTFGIIWKCDD
jgi:hypothetical protein